MDETSEIAQKALEFARLNKNRIARELTSVSEFVPDQIPISVFMAGSPGAGKTEFSKNLFELLEEEEGHKIVRIDGDEVRALMPGYTGANSSLFQGAISVIVDKLQDLALKHKQTFLLDGTLSRYDKAAENIRRSLAKNRSVFIFYLYQRPEVAWKFTLAREAVEGRNIPKEAFVEQFLAAKDTVEKISVEFGDRISIFLVKKDFVTAAVEYVVKIEAHGSSIDEYLKERYTEGDLLQAL